MAYKIALIGCGRVGVELEDDPLRDKPASHIGGINTLIARQEPCEGIELSAVCDIDEKKLEKCRHQWHVPRTYLDYRELFKYERPDFIIIASWTHTHRDIVLYAANHGVKGIVLEKPVAVNLQQAEEIIRCCHAHNIRIVVNHERRWGPKYRKVQQIIQDNRLGELKTINGSVLSQSAPYGPWEEILTAYGGGPLLHDGTHLIDMIRFFTGEISIINGHVSRDNPSVGVETTACAYMQSASGVNIFIEAGGMRDYFHFEIDLQFEKGRIKVGNGIKEYYESTSSRRYSGFFDLTPKPFPQYQIQSNPFTGALMEVINAVKYNQLPNSSGIDGFKAMEVIFAIYASASQGGKTIYLPLKIKGHPLKKMFQAGLI